MTNDMNDTIPSDQRVIYKRSWKSIALTAIATAVLVGGPLFCFGCVLGYMDARAGRYHYDVQFVNEIIANNPAHYSGLSINRGPLDKFRLEGTVRTKEIRENLKTELIHELGIHRTEDTFFVEVVEGD